MGGDWITPQNLKKMQKKDHSAFYGAQKQTEKVDVACWTRDFSMQNVLMQIGLPVFSEEGMLIRQAKKWAVRCYTCTKPDRDTNRIFCRFCGNNTLVRVAMYVSAEGTVTFSKLHHKPSKRGGQRVIPPPKSGRKATVYVTSEDQLLHFRPNHRRPKEDNVFDLDYQFGSSARTDYSKQQKIVIVGQGRKNPNESRKRVNKKKKNHSVS